ncbi:MAG: leucine-rich repeat protein [Firmicutes bacterium]|nr:leucine-rich repeat protein [Bacillota bacterium]
MSNSKVNKGKIFTALLLALCLTAIGFAFFNTQTYAYGAETEALRLARKYDSEILEYFRAPSIEDDFEDDKVDIILKSEYSRISAIGFDNFDEVSQKIEFISISDARSLVEKSENRSLPLRERKNQILTLELKVKGKEKVLEAANELSKLDIVLLAQPSYIYGVKECWTPNDPRYGEQWGLNGINGIQAEAAWDITKGNANVLVGVMEECFDVNHEDLQANVVTVTGVNTPSTGSETDHSTHVAGIIGAVSNNGVAGSMANAVAGVAQVSLVSLDWSSANFKKTLEDAEKGGIRIINASFRYSTNNGTTPASYSAVHFAALRDYDGLFVAAASNENTDLNTTPMYPACYNLPNVMAVGATNEDGTRATATDWGWPAGSAHGSNYGDLVQIYAPGTGILSTVPTSMCNVNGNRCTARGTHVAHGYHIMSGTSMATPHVSGTAALMLSANSALTAAQLKRTIINNADDITITVPDVSGGTTTQQVKRLNAHRAVSAAVFETSISGQGISVDGFVSGYTLPTDADLTLPNRFAPFGSPAGSAQQDVTAIGNLAFTGETELKSIVIPEFVTTIDDGAFNGCTKLTRVYIDRPAGQAGQNYTTLGSNVFAGTQIANAGSADRRIFVPSCSVDAYKGAAGWSAYAAAIIAGWSGTISDGFAGGDGISVPYRIGTGAQLARLARYPDDKSYVLTNDIYLNDTGDWTSWDSSTAGLNKWTPIGNLDMLFDGNFNGGGFAVKGIYISGENLYQGLFGIIDGGIVSNLGIEESYFEADYCVGSIAGYIQNGGIITNCYNRCDVKGGFAVGGIAGVIGDGIKIGCELTNNYSTGIVDCSSNSSGGIVGSSHGANTVKYNYFLKTSTINNNKNVAGGTTFPDNRVFDTNGNTLYDAANPATVSPITIDNSARSTLIAALNAFVDTSTPPLGVDYLPWEENNSFPVLGVFKYTLINSDTAYEITAASAAKLTGAVVIPSTHNNLQITAIGAFAFIGQSGITGVSIPASVTAIGDGAFSGCNNLTSITLPASVISVGDDVFSGCTKLTSIAMTASNAYYTHQDGVLYEKAASNTWSIKHVPYKISGNLGHVTILSGVTAIPASAFKQRSMTSVTIPASVTIIGDSAFNSCNSLTSVYFAQGSQLDTIGAFVFGHCYSLISIDLEQCIQLTAIGVSAFANCVKLAEITLPDSVTSIGESAFSVCVSLTGIIIPAGITTIDSLVFYWCSSLTEITIPAVITSIGFHAFARTGLTNVIFKPNGQLQTIDVFAFYECDSLVEFIVPDGVDFIGYYAFAYCTSLTKIFIPISVDTIDDYAFSGCSSLTIYTQWPSRPTGWSLLCNPSNRPVVWGYEADTCVVIFDKQGGDGSDYVVAIYGAPMPFAEAPARQGYFFGGYFDEFGIKYYDACMNSVQSYFINGDITLYAYWIDVGSVVWDGATTTNFISGNAGDGLSAQTAWRISDAAELAYLAQQVGGGNSYSDKYFVLTDYIYLNDTYGWQSWDALTANLNLWTPIGTLSSPFGGYFDGDGYAVFGIYISNNNDYQGLFGYSDYGDIINLGVEQSYIKGGDYVGGVAGYGYITNSYNSGSISGNDYVGGIAGCGGMSNCYNEGIISGRDYVAGVAGCGGVYSCYNTGDVSGRDYVGGITGSTGSEIYFSYNTGNISGNDYVGGIAGESLGLIAYCRNDGNISGGDYVGGIAGCVGQWSSATVVGSHNTGTVAGSINVGGVAGCLISGIAINNYNTGDIYGVDCIGGIAGSMFWSGYYEYFGGNSVPWGGVIANCYNIGDISNLDGNEFLPRIGGIVGYVGVGYAGSYAKIINNYNAGTLFTYYVTIYVGGIVGMLQYGTNTVDHNFATDANSMYIFGIVGYGSPYYATYNNYWFNSYGDFFAELAFAAYIGMGPILPEIPYYLINFYTPSGLPYLLWEWDGIGCPTHINPFYSYFGMSGGGNLSGLSGSYSTTANSSTNNSSNGSGMNLSGYLSNLSDNSAMTMTTEIYLTAGEINDYLTAIGQSFSSAYDYMDYIAYLQSRLEECSGSLSQDSAELLIESLQIVYGNLSASIA